MIDATFKEHAAAFIQRQRSDEAPQTNDQKI
jgi:hypothetical protein